VNTSHSHTGFTLVEMAIVLVIVALLIGGVLTPLSTQKEHERRKENQQLLEDAREALIGFAVVNGYLPCPDTDGDGIENTGPNPGDCSRLNATSADFYPNGTLGRLPWVTLGINAEFDPWGSGHFVRYAVNGAFVGDPVDGTFALTATGTGPGILEIHSDATDCGSPASLVALNVPAIVWTSAKVDYSPAPVASGDEIENVDNDNCFVDKEYNTAANSEYDDQMLWLSPNILFNRLISAGKLP
jgi:prepilin-type N-terminal cleavage/methylation domain-containing protein